MGLRKGVEVHGLITMRPKLFSIAIRIEADFVWFCHAIFYLCF